MVFIPYYPPHFGGLENYAAELHAQLIERGFDITVITGNRPLNAEPIQNLPNQKIIRLPVWEMINNYPCPRFWRSDTRGLWRVATKDRYICVISHTRFFLFTLLAGLLAKQKNIPWLHIEHGSAFVQLSSPWKTFLAKLYDLTVGRWVLKHSHINIAISQSAARFINQFDLRPVPVIYRGLKIQEIDQIPAYLPSTLNNAKQKPILIISAARLYRWKGFEYAIEAINDLPEDIKTQIQYAILGQGEDFQRLQKIARPPVVLLDYTPRPQTLGLFKSANIFIHSSLPGGGLSTSLLEAMYCECSIVATPNEGADEFIVDQQNGLLVADQNSQAIREAVTKLVQNSSLQHTLAQQAKKTITQNISWSRSMRKFEEVLSRFTEIKP